MVFTRIKERDEGDIENMAAEQDAETRKVVPALRVHTSFIVCRALSTFIFAHFW